VLDVFKVLADLSGLLPEVIKIQSLWGIRFKCEIQVLILEGSS